MPGCPSQPTSTAATFNDENWILCWLSNKKSSSSSEKAPARICHHFTSNSNCVLQPFSFFPLPSFCRFCVLCVLFCDWLPCDENFCVVVNYVINSALVFSWAMLWDFRTDFLVHHQAPPTEMMMMSLRKALKKHYVFETIFNDHSLITHKVATVENLKFPYCS